MANPRTIDNLGPEVSQRYAEDSKLFDKRLIEEGRIVSDQITVQVTSAFLPVQSEEFFSLQPSQIPWAFFDAPPAYYEQQNELFTHLIIPSMGTEDKQESLAQKLETMQKQGQAAIQDKKQQYAAKQALEEQQRQQEKLTAFLETLSKKNKELGDINARRIQYLQG